MTVFLSFLLSLVFLSSPQAGRNNNNSLSAISQKVNFMPTFTDSTFTVQNQTSVNVGWVTILAANSTNSYINVTTTGTFTTTQTDYPVECSIHGHSFGIGVPTRIIIDAHNSVRATWTSSVIVIDQGETM